VPAEPLNERCTVGMPGDTRRCRSQYEKAGPGMGACLRWFMVGRMGTEPWDRAVVRRQDAAGLTTLLVGR
jgi:hypothetical protein